MLSRLARTFRRDDAGVALVMVIGIGSVLALLTIAAVAVALGGIRSARNDQDWNGALAAAFAGVEEYQSRLAADTGYERYGNPAAAFTTASHSVVVLPPADRSNPAFGLGASGTWATVPGSEAASTPPASTPVTGTATAGARTAGDTASFRYEVDTSQFALSGTISLRSTGRVGTETRSVVSELRVNSFLDYLYFTDYEIEDPSQYLAAAVVPCSKYAYAGRPTGNFTAGGTTTSCHNIAFGDKDLLTGPVHSNDLIRACSAEFAGPVTTAATRATPTSPLYSSVDSTDKACTASTFRDPASPSSIAPVVMPATNTSLKLQTRTDLAAVTSPGCLYSGPTDIVFNSNGTVTVRSPWTKATRVSGSPATGGNALAACGVVGPTGLGSAAGSTFAVPDHNVMYVQEVPAVLGDPNYYAAGSVPLVGTGTGTANLSCTGASHQANGNGLGYPMKDEIAPTTTAYGCRSGDAFVRGVLNGAVTVATSNFLYVTGDTTYAAGTQAVLGLVGDGAVFVWNPVNSAGASLLNDDSLGPDRGNGRTIHAAILSVAHTFQVQGHTTGGARGTLTIVGAIAQKYRGIVRSGDIGYVKNYSYDLRFSYLTPPKYLMPVSTTYGVIVWIEVSAAFTRTGAAR